MSDEQERETSTSNRRVILISRPKGAAQAENFAIREAAVELLAGLYRGENKGKRPIQL